MPIARSDKRTASDRLSTTNYFIHSLTTLRPRHPGRARRSAAKLRFFDDLVVIARGNTPDPIPNSAVKTLSANGTPS